MDFLSYFSVMFLQKQLKNLRDMLKKCLDKRNGLSRSGEPAKKLPKCQFSDQVAFLCEMSANKPSETNLPPMLDPHDRGARLIIPAGLQICVIKLAHEGHQGLAKTKALLHEYVWFPDIDKLVKEEVGTCITGQQNPQEPLQ